MNLLLVPLTALLIPLGLLTSLLALLYEPLGTLLMPLTAGLLHIYINLPQFAAQLPLMSFYVPTQPAIWLVLYYALLIAIPLWIPQVCMTFGSIVFFIAALEALFDVATGRPNSSTAINAGPHDA